MTTLAARGFRRRMREQDEPDDAKPDLLWVWWAGAGLLLFALGHVLPSESLRDWCSIAALAIPVAAIPLGVKRHRPANKSAWGLLWFGFGCFAVGWAVLVRLPLNEGHIWGPALPHLPAIPAVALAVALIIHSRHFPRDLDSILDAAIVGAAMAFVGWFALLEPAYADAVVNRSTLALITVYPALDLLLLVALVHLTFTLRERPAAWMFLLVGTGICLFSDIVLAVVTSHGEAPGVARDVAALGYLLVGLGALHPSMVQVASGGSPSDQRLGPIRIGMLGGSLLTTPIVILLSRAQDVQRGSGSLLLPSGLLSFVILVRMVDLARRAEHARSRDRDRERRFETLVRNSSDLVAVISIDGELTYVSPAVEAILGIDQRLATERSLGHWVHPDDAELALNELLSLKHRGDTTETTIRLRHGDGTWRWMEIHAVNLVKEAGVEGVVINCRDVTDRIAAEEVIVASNVQQAAVAELGREALEGRTMDELARHTAATVAETLRVSSCTLYFVNAAGDVELTASQGDPTAQHGPIGRLHDHPLLERCLRTTELLQIAMPSVEGPLPDPIDIPELPLAPARSALPRGIGHWVDDSDDEATALAVRITDGAQPFGVMLVRADDKRRFRVDEASFLQSMASTLGLAIARREVEFEARHQALHDELTGLPNRALFVDRLTNALARIDGWSSTLAVLFLDVDHFKVVNDSLGHNAGDRILLSVADRLRKLLRPSDTIARFGGDEFTVLCEGLDNVDAALDVARRIREELSAPLTVGRAEIHTTVSVGLAIASHPGMVPEAMLRDADAAMYRAKERGRNRVELFDDSMRMRAITRLRTEIALREAMGNGQLVLHYQPVIDLSSGQVLAAEALVRWSHPSEGLIPPARFIPIAEEAGLINDLGRWVLTEAVRQVSTWHAEYGPLTPVLGINVSARTLGAPGFTADVASILRNADVPPNFVCLEITESAIMDDVERSLEVLRQLRSLGLTLAIDDFGTGYSSLSYLKRFPIDVLKIDRSFTDGLGREAEDSAIVAAVVNLAHTLDRLSIAEGVETALQLSELQRLGCPLGQGFLFSKAVPSDDFDVLTGYEICADAARLNKPVRPVPPGA